MSLLPIDYDRLAADGVLIDRELISSDLCEKLLQEAIELQSNFRAAGISRGHIKEASIRADSTYWLDDKLPVANAYLKIMESLRSDLNQEYFLGLKSYEAHYARYQEGQFYKTHIDNFKNQGPRRITTVMFLNKGWKPQNAGELIIYHPETHQELHRILPEAPTLVVFKSETYPHEVLAPLERDRFSIAGWFRID